MQKSQTCKTTIVLNYNLPINILCDRKNLLFSTRRVSRAQLYAYLVQTWLCWQTRNANFCMDVLNFAPIQERKCQVVDPIFLNFSLTLILQACKLYLHWKFSAIIVLKLEEVEDMFNILTIIPQDMKTNPKFQSTTKKSYISGGMNEYCRVSIEHVRSWIFLRNYRIELWNAHL